jgi:hypothetical protein
MLISLEGKQKARKEKLFPLASFLLRQCDVKAFQPLKVIHRLSSLTIS